MWLVSFYPYNLQSICLLRFGEEVVVWSSGRLSRCGRSGSKPFAGSLVPLGNRMLQSPGLVVLLFLALMVILPCLFATRLAGLAHAVGPLLVLVEVGAVLEDAASAASAPGGCSGDGSGGGVRVGRLLLHATCVILVLFALHTHTYI